MIPQIFTLQLNVHEIVAEKVLLYQEKMFMCLLIHSILRRNDYEYRTNISFIRFFIDYLYPKSKNSSYIWFL